MYTEFEVSDLIPATPDVIYQAWLDSAGHSDMTGSIAQVSNVVGGSFEAWDGYIKGENLELEPPSRILQSWRTTEFDDSDEDSRLEILLEAQKKSTLITIRHSRLPEDGMQYRQGWIDFYFKPMKEYFGKDK
jgi:activator of HSP90 ATPase